MESVTYLVRHRLQLDPDRAWSGLGAGRKAGWRRRPEAAVPGVAACRSQPPMTRRPLSVGWFRGSGLAAFTPQPPRGAVVSRQDFVLPQPPVAARRPGSGVDPKRAVPGVAACRSHHRGPAGHCQWGGFEAQAWRPSHLNHREAPWFRDRTSSFLNHRAGARRPGGGVDPKCAVPGELPVGRNHRGPAGRCQWGGFELRPGGLTPQPPRGRRVSRQDFVLPQPPGQGPEAGRRRPPPPRSLVQQRAVPGVVPVGLHHRPPAGRCPGGGFEAQAWWPSHLNHREAPGFRDRTSSFLNHRAHHPQAAVGFLNQQGW